MVSTLAVLAVLAVLAARWLSHQGLATKPWLEPGIGAEDRPPGWPAATIGLAVFLAVAACLFGLLLSAFSMRMQGGFWRPLPASGLLWVNTAALVAAGAALQWAKVSADRGEVDGVGICLLAGGVFSLAFLAGQVILWQQLVAAGYGLASPAGAFFILLTGLHGLHLAGGLVALGRTGVLAWDRPDPARLRLSVSLCAAYWHFLLLVWLLVAATLSGFAGLVIETCRQWLA